MGAAEIANKLSNLTDPKLSKLDIAGNELGDEGVKAIADSLSKLTDLTYLNMFYNKLGKEGAQTIAAFLSKLTNLTNFNISSNKIGDKGAKAIAASLPNLTKLTEFNVSYNGIGDEGVGAIVDGLSKLTDFTSLKTIFNGMGRIGLGEIAKLANLTTLNIGCNNADFVDADVLLSNLKNCAINFGGDIAIKTYTNVIQAIKRTTPDGNLTPENVKDIVFKLATQDRAGKSIQHIINSPEKYPFAINSRDNVVHSLLDFYNHSHKMQQFLFQHGAVPEQEQEQEQDNRLNTLARDTQSVHTTEAVKLVNFITDNLFKAYGNIENKQQLLVKAEEYQAGLTKLDQVYQNSIKLKLLSLSDGAKRDTMKKTLVANQPTPSDQDYVATVIEKAKIALTTIYLGKTNGQYNPGYPTHEMEYGDGHKITIPQSLGLVKSLIDTMEIPVAEKLELLVTLMRQNPELVESKLKIIQDKLNINVPSKILVDSTTCHKFLASNPVIKKTPQIIGDLFNSISDLDIDQTWREQKAFTVAENIYIAATAYGKDKTACLQGVLEDIVNSVTEINKDFYNEFIKLQEQNLEEERARTSITENNIQEFIGVLAKKLINFVDEDKPALQERLADLEFATIDMTKPQYISIEQQEFLAQINTAFAEIKKYLPNYNRKIPTSDEYDLIIKMLAKHPLIEKFATDHYKLQESALQLEDYISAHSLVEEPSQPLDDQDVVKIIGDEGY